MLRLFLCVTFTIALMSCLKAQDMHIRPQVLNNANGLKSGFYNFVKTDRKGSTWISSGNGVFRHDPTEVKRYLSSDDFMQSSFYEDQQGNLWCSSYSKLFKYDRLRDTFDTFQIQYNQDSILDQNYRVFHLEQDSIVWLRAGDYIYRFNGTTHKASKVIASKGINFGVQSNAQGAVQKIYACLWHNHPSFEVIDFSNQSQPSKMVLFHQRMLEEELEFTNLSIQQDSLIWLFSNKGLYAFDPTHQNQLEKISLGKYTSHKILMGIQVNQNTLLLPITNAGLWLFDSQQKKLIKQVKIATQQTTEIDLQNISSIYLDSNDKLWISHKNGGVSFAWFYEHDFSLPFQENKKATPAIRTIAEDRNNTLWCNTQAGNIFNIDSSGKMSSPLEDKVNTLQIRKISQDEVGNIWAINKNKIYRFQESTSSWQEEFSDTTEQFFFLTHLSNQHKLVATMNGIMELHKPADQWEIMPSDSPTKKYVTEGLQLFKGESKRIYISNKSSALKIFKVQNHRLKLIHLLAFKAEVYSIYEDSLLERTWLGTNKGVSYFDWKKKQIFDGPTGLQNMIVSGLIKDKKHRLWATSYGGLFCQQDDALYHYGIEDGLPSATFPLYASRHSSDGKIWLGTDKGLVGFHPDAIQPYPYIPSLVFENLKINNEVPTSHIDFQQTNTVGLAHHEHTLSFDLRAFTHHLPHLNKIHYRLTGYDDIWRSILHKGHLRFAQLKPGNYILEIFAANANGVKGDLRKITIQINPPWWTTWWALSLFVITFISFIYAVYLFLLNRKLKEQKRLIAQQRALQEERNRIAGELHDDLGAGLSVIRFLSTPKAKQKSVSPDPKKINRIYQSAGELMEKMSDIIWAMNTENDNLENLSAYIQQYIYEYLDYQQIAFELNIPRFSEEVILSGKQRRNILLVVKESLHNVVKHAQASKVFFSMQLENKLLIIQLKDNGKGLENTQASSFGNGLKNIRKRMKEIGGEVDFQSEQGTNVVLTIPIE